MNKTFKSIITLMLAATILISSMQTFAFTVFSANAPAVPQNVKAVSASYNSIKVSWSPVNSASGYVVYRYNPAKKAYDRLIETKSASFTNTGLITGSTYTYKTRAYQTVSGKNIYGNPSSAVSAKPIPSIPANLKVSSQSEDSITLTWSAVSGASGYVVYRYNAITKAYICVKVTKSTRFTNTGLITGMTYYYKARAYRTVNGSNIYGNLTGTALSAKARAFRLEDLNGKKVAVQRYTSSDDFAQALLDKGEIKFEILRYDRMTQCYDALHSGKADAVLVDEIVAADYPEGSDKVVWRCDAGEPMGIVLKNDKDDLTALVEGAIDTLYFNGTVAQIATKYFGSDITKGVRTVTTKPVLDLTKLKTIKDGTLTVGMEIGYPPMEYLANNGVTYIGFDVELAQKLASLLGLKLEIVNTAWDGIFAALNKGEFDMIISAVSITAERQANFNVTKPYFLDHQVIIVPN